MVLPIYNYANRQAYLEATIADAPNARGEYLLDSVTYRNLTSQTFRLDVWVSATRELVVTRTVAPGTPYTTVSVPKRFGLFYTAATDGEGMDPNFDYQIMSV